MTQTKQQKSRQLQREHGDRERYFKSYRFSPFEVDYLTSMLSAAIGRDLACDEKGLASALRFIAAEKDGRVWRHSLRVIANALDNDKTRIHLRLVRAKRGPVIAKTIKDASEKRRSECARFLFERIAGGQPQKVAMADAAAEFGVSKKTIFVWLESAADKHRQMRRIFVAIYDTPEERVANDVYRTDPFSMWLENYESRPPDNSWVTLFPEIE